MTLWSPRFLAGLLAFSFFLTACGEDDASARQGRRGGPIPVVAEPATLEAERLRLEAVGTSRPDAPWSSSPRPRGTWLRSPSPLGTS